MYPNNLDPEQRRMMRELWGKPGSPFHNRQTFDKMLADREHFAAKLDRQGAHELAQVFRKGNAAMRKYALELERGETA